MAATQTPLVSVIVAAYNAAPYVQQAMQSLLDQTYPNLEILAADDASTDGTRALLDGFAQHSNVRLDHNTQNLHCTETRRKLMHQAKGEFIAVQDADDLSDPTRLALQVQALQANPSWGAVGCGFWSIDPQGQRIRQVTPETDPAALRQLQQQQNQFCGPTLVYRRSVLEALGHYRPYFSRKGAEEIDLVQRIMAQQPVGNLPQPLYHYRMAPTSVSRSRTRLEQHVVMELARRLYLQRLATGTDDLDQGRIQALEDELTAPYRQDPARLPREMAAIHNSEGNAATATAYAWAAVRARPSALLNWRALGYTLRRRWGLGRR